MCDPNIEEIVTFLSTKFNKIFCDRDFICCVLNDFHILKNRSKCRVLVFPTLGPVYQRALKYQAEAFDFATFELSVGIFKIIAVCQKEYILRKEKQDLKVHQEKNMPNESACTTQDNSGRKRRPERQLYVPPAQRRLASSKETDNETKHFKQSKCNSSNGKVSKTASNHNKSGREVNKTNHKEITSKSQYKQGNDSAIIDLRCDEKSAIEHDKFSPSLIDLIKLDLLSLPTYNMVFLRNKIPSLTSFHGYFCEFHQYLSSRFKNDLKLGISIFHINNNQITEVSKDKIGWRTFIPYTPTKNSEVCETEIPPFHCTKSELNNLSVNQSKLCSAIGLRYSSERLEIMQDNVIGDGLDVDVIFKEDCDTSENLSYICDSEIFENIVDLTEYNLGHFFRIELSDNEHFHICSQSHNVKNCYLAVKRDLLSKSNAKLRETQCNQENKSKTEPHKPVEILQQTDKEPDVLKISDVESQPVRKMEAKKIIDSKKKCQHDEEIEIMRKTKENINRRTRPLMKYSDDGDDLLRIDKQDNVNNWEDLFDEEGQIQEDLLTEIVHKVGKDLTIVKATEDYTPYMPKSTDDLDHVVEIYNFPSSLTTGDIIHAFNMFDSDSMYVVWVDETHALLVLGSSSQAQKAVEVKNPFIKVRPLSKGSVAALTAASKNDLKPAMKRPQTNLQTARRLITTHLGTKSQVTKEQRALERENLRKAREQKKMMRQNERDAWEGNIH